MFVRRFFRSMFAVCGSDADVHKQDYGSISKPCPTKENCSGIDDEIHAMKRSRALTMETERASFYSERHSCVSSEDDKDRDIEDRLMIPPITLGQVTLQGVSDCDGGATDHTKTDPITLEPLMEPLYIYTCSPGGRVIEYNLSSFVEYLLSTGDFRDPITRTALSIVEVGALDALVAAQGLTHPLLVERFHDKATADNEDNAANTIRGLESCVGEIICDILSNIESSSKNGTYQMSMLFSELDLPFAEMKALSIEAAYQALQTWIVFLKGPPKKPTKDTFGRLRYAVSYLNGLWTSDDKLKLCAIRAAHA